jgi:hypothetical protein
MSELEQPMPRGLKITFFLNFLIAGLVGLQHLLVPRWWTDFAGISVVDTGLWRLIGAAVVGYATGSALVLRSSTWRSVRIVVAMQAVWSLLGAGVITWAILYEDLPAMEWLNAGLLAAFGVAFALYLNGYGRAG